MQISYTVKGVKELVSAFQKFRKDDEKALETAIKVEGFRLMKLLKTEIRQGKPGKKPYAPLTYIARRYKKRRAKALTRLAIGVRYHIIKNPYLSFHFGWVGPKVSKSWKRLAEIHQKGFKRPITEKQRRWFISDAEGRTPRMRKYFFIRKSTTYFKTPARPILDPFWNAYRKTAEKNIEENWAKKLKGERI